MRALRVIHVIVFSLLFFHFVIASALADCLRDSVRSHDEHAASVRDVHTADAGNLRLVDSANEGPSPVDSASLHCLENDELFVAAFRLSTAYNPKASASRLRTDGASIRLPAVFLNGFHFRSFNSLPLVSEPLHIFLGVIQV